MIPHTYSISQRVFTITTTAGERFHMLALGPADARQRFADCKLGIPRAISEDVTGKMPYVAPDPFVPRIKLHLSATYGVRGRDLRLGTDYTP